VHVNRDDLHDVAVPNSFETTGSFTIELVNHGEPLHVHLHLDDALSQVAELEAGNHYVEAERTRQVRVEASPKGSVRGKLKVVAAYGATTRYVDVIISEPEETEDSVQVDESLGKPQPRDEPRNESRNQSLAVRPEIAVLALGAAAILVAILAVLVLQSTIVALGALAVLTGVLVAMYLLYE
jgi:energy-converting hydrogenase Eha subunit A